MTTSEKLMHIYLMGFNDELDGKTTVEHRFIGESSNFAYDISYDIGSLHAIVGDDVSSVDYLSNDQILKEITHEIYNKYEELANDVKYQMDYIDDFYEFDFIHLDSTLQKMKELQKTIREL